MHDHVAVIEHADGRRIRRPVPVAVDVRKWFEEHTHRAMTNRLEDGSDLDVDQYVNHYIDLSTGEAKERGSSATCCPAAVTSPQRCCSTAVRR